MQFPTITHTKDAFIRTLLIAAGFVLASITTEPLLANPDGGNVVAGSATINQAGNTVTVNQNSNTAIINWNGFSIANGETTRFNQPNSNSIALNRVIGNDPSNIFGNLIANGKIMLINPNGIMFGSTSRVDVAGLIASTADISNTDFLNGNYKFSQNPNKNFGIVNNGEISVQDQGLVALVAPGVQNNGIIRANLGKVLLASGTEFTIVDTYGDGLITFATNSKTNQKAIAPDGTVMNDAVANHGTIIANGGTVLITARAAGDVVDNVVNMSGVVEANSVAARNGEIILLGGNEGTVRVSGTLKAQGTQANKNGGFIETSGAKVKLDPSASVSTVGYNGGQTGTWLIDPTDYTIAASGGDITGAYLSAALEENNMQILSTNDIGNPNGNGDIFVNDIVNWSANTTLTLNAIRNVEINQAIQGQNLTLVAGGVITQNNTAGLTVTNLTATSSNGMAFNATNNVITHFTATDTSATAGISLNNTQALVLGNIQATGPLNITTNGTITQNGSISVAGTATLAAGTSNDITLDNTNNNFGSIGITSGRNIILKDQNALVLNASTISGTLGITTTGAITQTGALSVTGATTLAAGIANDITLDNSNNNFSSIGITSGRNVTLRNQNALALNTSTINGTLGITTSGALTQNGALAVIGATTLTAGTTSTANDITLDNSNNNFSSIGITSGRNVILKDQNALVLNASTISGALDITTSGAITQSGILNVTGAANFNAGAGAITLTSNNLFNNTVSLANTGTNNIALTNDNVLTLGTVNMSSGTLSLISKGSINQTGSLKNSGTINATLTADGDINLNNTGNIFTALRFGGDTSRIKNLDLYNSSFTSSTLSSLLPLSSLTNLKLTSAGAIVIPEVTLQSTGNLTVNAGGNVTQAGQIVVPGSTDITNTAGTGINLNITNNKFTGAVALTNTGGSGAITLNNNGDLVIGGIKTDTGALTIDTKGTLSQTGYIQANGAATFSAIGGITLNDPNNQIAQFSANNTVSGKVLLTNIGNLVINGISNTGGDAITIDNTGNLTTAGAITLSTTSGIQGAINLNTLGASNNLNINSAITNNGTGGINFDAGNQINLGNNSNIISNSGAINFNDAVVLTSNAVINAAMGNITFNSTLDGAYTPTLTSGGTVTFIGNVGNNVALNGLTTSSTGNTNIQGNITTTGAQTYNNTVTIGNSTLSAGNSNITLNGAVNVSNALTLQAGTLAINNAITGGNLTIDVTGNITPAGAINVNNFTLTNGNWSQTGALPTFTVANNFNINAGNYSDTVKFLRVIGGDGSAANPYQITDIYGLQGIASDSSFLSKNYVLNNNINAAPTANWTNGFVSIGNTTNQFTGSLKSAGNNQVFTINGLTINSTNSNVGLFGVTGASANLSYLSLTNANIKGAGNVGGLVGLNNGTINFANLNSLPGTSNTITGTADNVGGLVGNNQTGSVTNSYANAAIQAAGSLHINNVGGLVGRNTGSISTSYSAGTINANNVSNVGGLVGNNLNFDSTIQNAYSTSAITTTNSNNIGGLVGLNSGLINKTYATGAINGTTNVGGFVGNNQGNIQNSFWDTDTTGKTTGIGANNAASTLLGGCFTGSCTNGGTVNLSDPNTYLTAGWSIASGPSANLPTNTWLILPGQIRPLLQMEASNNTNNVITNAHQLELVNFALSGSYTLGNNINLSTVQNSADVWGGKGFAPIGTQTQQFTGTFNGNNNTISNLYINTNLANGTGLFGFNNGTIQNVILSVVDITNTAADATNIGTLVGQNNGTIRNAKADGTLKATGTSQSNIGGLVGQNTATGRIEPAANTGTFSSSNVAVTSSGVSSSNIGNLIGDNTGTVNNVFSTGSLTIDGNNTSNIGGLIGHNAGYVTNAFSKSTLTINKSALNIGGFVGTNDTSGNIEIAYSKGVLNTTAGASSNIGGFVGNSMGNISNAYSQSPITINGIIPLSGSHIGGFAGTQTSGAIQNAYAANKISVSFANDSTIGAFVGTSTGGSNSNNFFDKSVNSGIVNNNNLTGITGKTTTDMKSQTTFTNAGWNFNNVWGIMDGQSYPYLTPLELGVHVVQVSGNSNAPTASINGTVLNTSQYTLTSSGNNYYYIFSQPDLVSNNPIVFYNATGTAANGLIDTTIARSAVDTLTLSANNIQVGGSNGGNFKTSTFFVPSAAGVLFADSNGLLTLTNNATLITQSTNPATLTIDTAISGNGSINLAGSTIIQNNGAAINTSGAQTYRGAVTLNSNANLTTNNVNGIQFTNTSSITGNNYNLTINTNNAAGNSVINGIYTGNGDLNVNGTGTLTINSANHYHGDTTVSYGSTLAVGNDQALGDSILYVDGGTLVSTIDGITLTNAYTNANNNGLSLTSFIGGNHSLALTGTGTLTGQTLAITNTGTTTLNNTLTGSSAINAFGGGELVINGNSSSFTGNTTISNNSQLTVGHNNALGSGVLTLNNGGLQSNTAVTLNNQLVSNGLSWINGSNNLTLSSNQIKLNSGLLDVRNSAITDFTGNLQSAGTLSISGGSTGVVNISNGNAGYTGTTILNTGNLAINTTAANALGTGTGYSFMFNGGTLSAAVVGTQTLTNNFLVTGITDTSTIGGSNNLTLTGNGILTAQLTFNNTAATTLTGNLFGLAGSMMQNTGTVTLSGNNSTFNTLFTGTRINGGTLNATTSTALLGDVTNSGILNLQGSGLNVSNKLTLNNGTLQSTGGNNTYSGAITLANNSANTIQSNSASNTFTINNAVNDAGDLTLTGPGTVALGSAGVIGNTSAIKSLTSNTNLTIGANTIRTLNNQTYSNVTLNTNTAFTTTTNGNILFNGTVNGTSRTLTLNAKGNITEGTNGILNLATLSATATNGISLNNSNGISTFTATDTSTNGISLTNNKNLTLNAVSTGTSGGNITINNTAGSGGSITQGSGAITTTGQLSTASVGGTTLNNTTNAISTFTATNSGSGNIALTNNKALTVNGINQTTTNGSITLRTIGNNNPLTINGNVTSNNGAITYTADQMNLIGNTNAGTSIITLQTDSNSRAINLGGADSSSVLGLTQIELNTLTANTLRIGKTNNTGNITLTSAITSPTTNLSLLTAGQITQQGGATLTASNLKLSGGTGVNLTEANQIGTVAGNLTAGNFTLKNAQGLTLGTVDGTSGITNNNGNITLASPTLNNQVSANALTATNGRWLVYLNSPNGNTFGGLVSGNQAIWHTTFPTAITQTGNRYVFEEPQQLTITVNDLTKTYGQDYSTQVAGVGYTVTGFVNASNYGNVFTQDTIANTTNIAVAAGDHPIGVSAGSATTANVDSYAIKLQTTNSAAYQTTTGYDLVVDEGTLTVNKAILTITGNKTYDTTTDFTGGTHLTALGVNGETLTLTGNMDASSANAGTYGLGSTSDLILSNGTGLASNYTLENAAGSLTINKASLTINGSKTYDTTTTFNGGILTATGVNGQTLTLTGFTDTSSANANTYNLGSTANLILGDGTGLASNYTLENATGSLTINKASLTINGEKTYNKDNTFTGGTNLTVTGINGQTLTLTGTMNAASSNAGTYGLSSTANLTLGDGTGLANNYTLDNAAGSLTINKAAITITAGTDQKVYDGTTSSSATGSFSGTFGTDHVTNITQTFASKDVMGANGSTLNITGYTVNDGNNGGNYTVTLASATGTITPAQLTITANNDTKIYNGIPYLGGNGVTFNGFVNGESANNLGGHLIYGGNSQLANTVGTYQILPGGLTSTNYDITFVGGTLTIIAPNTSSVDGVPSYLGNILSGYNDCQMLDFPMPNDKETKKIKRVKTSCINLLRSTPDDAMIFVNLNNKDYVPVPITLDGAFNKPLDDLAKTNAKVAMHR